MKALLVYSECPPSFWEFHGALSISGQKAAFPPLGSLTIASMFPKTWEKKLVDINVKPLTDEHIKWADIVFVSAMLIQLQSTNEVIKRCKDFGKIVVGGGPAFTTASEKFPGVDHVLRGEAENVLPTLLLDLESGNALPSYTCQKFPDLRETPLPEWHLINLSDYATISVQFSRGCPFKCEFCNIRKIFGEKVRTKTPTQMIAELQALYERGWRGSVFIVDDNFIGNKVAAKRFLRVLIAWQKEYDSPFKFFSQVSINLADDLELLLLMREANFYQVFVGIETPNLDALRECGKYQNLKRNLFESVKIIQENGMRVMGGFMVGFDSDTPAIFKIMPVFIKTAEIVTAMAGPVIALPETDLYIRLEGEGRIDPRYDKWDNTFGDTNIVPKMGKETLLKGYKLLIKELYSPENYYGRIYAQFRTYRRTVKSKISGRDIKAFLRSLWKIGVLSKQRWLYWKLLVKTALTKPSLLSEAVTQAIFGEHFIDFAERITK